MSVGGGIGFKQKRKQILVVLFFFFWLLAFSGGNADYAVAMHQKEQLHDNSMSMMQSQHFSMGRSVGFNLGATYSSHRPQQQQQHAPSVSSSGVSFTPGNNQDLLHVHGSDMFPSSHSSYHSQFFCIIVFLIAMVSCLQFHKTGQEKLEKQSGKVKQWR